MALPFEVDDPWNSLWHSGCASWTPTLLRLIQTPRRSSLKALRWSSLPPPPLRPSQPLRARLAALCSRSEGPPPLLRPLRMTVSRCLCWEHGDHVPVAPARALRNDNFHSLAVTAQLAAMAAQFEKKAADPVPAPAPKPAPASAPAPAPAPSRAPAPDTTTAAAEEEEEPASSGSGASASASASAGASSTALTREEVDELLAKTDPREHMNVVFMGHVDAGKSTLSGNILFLTGMVDARTIEKFTREAKAKNRDSWFLAYIMDTDEQEREKGKTVEVGRAQFETTSRRFTILDAPGHKSFVPNMIQGAAQADIGVLVISARKGEFEAGFEKGGQTREHAQLAKTLGVKDLVVAVNKMDESTVNWSKERYDEIQASLTPFLKSAGFSKKHVTYLPISALTGANVKERLPAGVCGWYSGDCLLGLLDQLEPHDRDPYAPLRVPIIDRFNERGTIAMGKIEAGVLYEGQSIVVMPLRETCTVDKIFFDDDTETKVAKPGENVRVRLKGVTDDDILKGYVLCDPHAPVHAVTKFQAQLMLMNLDHKGIFTAGYKAVMHVHTADEEVTCEKITSEFDKKTGEPKKAVPRFIKSGGVCTCVLSLTRKTCLEKFDVLQQLGRFTLRDEGRTIALGKVIGLPRSEVA
jgi:peptide chain release factor subunit 3